MITRNTDTLDVINQRVDKASYELTFAPKFDIVIINDDLKQAEAKLLEAVKMRIAQSI